MAYIHACIHAYIIRSTADWLANKVLKKIVFSKASKGQQQQQHIIQQRVLDYTRKPNSNLWYRRCGVVSFLQYHKHREVLPPNFGSLLIQACEDSLTTSPTERFTQTGVAWVLRYVLIQQQEKEERDEAYEMIIRCGHLWNTEAKRSLTEKLSKSDPRKQHILSL